jgi:rhodanese-related sulfurtransferase
MITGNPEKAREFFAAKMAFTTGPVELKGMVERKENVIVVDVRRPEDYAKGHIPGAINLPHGQWHTAKGLSKDRLHVVYCYAQTCHLAAAAALEFASQGYRVMELEGGFAAWTTGKNAVEGSDHARDTAA